MIVSWMMFATVIGLLLTGAALAAERLAKALKLPTRPVWSVAFMMTVAWPIVASLRVATAGTTLMSIRGSVTIPKSGTTPMATMFASLWTVAWRMLTGDVGRMLGRGLLVMWGLFSLALVGRLLWSMWQLHRRQHTWRHADVDGVAVRLSSDMGPAVIGVRSMEVVLPEWVLAFDAPLRALILCHEQEHRSAGDPRMLLLTTLVVAFVPWNVALWWQSRRLRLAIEVDCDDRVLATHPQQERYGLLLLALAQRKTKVPTRVAPALVESKSHLEWRIIAIRNRALPVPRLHALGVGVAAISMVALACAVAPPTRLPTANQTVSLAGLGSVGNDITTLNVASIRQTTPVEAVNVLKLKVGNDSTTLNVASIRQTTPVEAVNVLKLKVGNDSTTLNVASIRQTTPVEKSPPR